MNDAATESNTYTILIPKSDNSNAAVYDSIPPKKGSIKDSSNICIIV